MNFKHDCVSRYDYAMIIYASSQEGVELTLGFNYSTDYAELLLDNETIEVYSSDIALNGDDVILFDRYTISGLPSFVMVFLNEF